MKRRNQSQSINVVAFRRGISLIEVIACTAIVAVMIVPVAGVIRASGRAIERSSEMNAEAKLRTGVRWIRDAIRDGSILDIGSQYITLLLSTGQKVELVLDSNQLILSDGRSRTVILENIERFETSPHLQSESPYAPIGLSMRILGVDPKTKQTFDIQSMISMPAGV